MDMQPITPLPMIAQARKPERHNGRMTASVADIGFVRADNLKDTGRGVTTNPHDAIMTTLFLMSSGNLATANTTDLYILAWRCDLTKLLDLTSRSRANTLKRGYMLQQVQIYNNSAWSLSATEKDSLTTWRLTHGACFFDINNQRTWEELGFLRMRNVVLRVAQLTTRMQFSLDLPKPSVTQDSWHSAA